MSSWHKYDLEPHGSLVEEVPPREDVSSDRPLSMSVPSLAADPGRIRLLEGLSKEERNAILGAASYRRLSRHTVVRIKKNGQIICFFSSKALPGISSSHQAARKYICSGLRPERYSVARPFCRHHRSFSLAQNLSKTAACSYGNATQYELSLHDTPDYWRMPWPLRLTT